MHIPQLRVRTGFSFRECYGQIDDIAARLQEIGATSAGIVDAGTWGHVTFEKEMKKAGVTPMFGMEVPIYSRDEEGERGPFSPRAWMLAKDTRKFYNATTQSVQNRGMTREEFGCMQGMMNSESHVYKFAGGAIDSLRYGDYDYIDLNPASIVTAHRGMHHHRLTGIPIVITSYNDMPSIDDASYAYGWEVRDSVGIRHIATVDEIWSKLQLIMTRKEFDLAVAQTHLVAECLKGVSLQKAPIIEAPGDLLQLCRAGQAVRLATGRIPEWTPVYEERLIEEIRQIQFKKFDSYFVVVADLIQYAKKHMFVGPARGSAAGSLVCFLMGITEIDPLPYNLLFQRFIDISREDFPDIDIDFSDSKRYMVFDYLREKYGASHVSKVGNVSTLQPKSVLPQVGKKFKLPASDSFNLHNVLYKYADGDPRYGHALEDTFNKTGPGAAFKERNPEAAHIMEVIETHPSHTSVHAGGVLVCNDPISDFCTLTEDGVAQIDKVDAEYLNLLKIDALGLRTLGIIEDSGVIDAATLYGLPFDDPEVLAVIANDQCSGVFQFEGAAVRSATKQIENFNRFEQIVNLTALARPGPMGSGMDRSYINRANGKEKVTYDFPLLESHLKETFGVIVYQEQLMSIIREIGGFDWAKTSAVRKGMAKSKGEEYLNQWKPDFVSGAVKNGVHEEDAEKLWKEMSTFGAYGFNKSHSVAYGAVTYWTCYLKRYHRLEFAAACLRAAKDDDQTIAILRELAAEGVSYTPIDPDYSEMNWKVADGRLIGGIMNAKGYGAVKALKFVEDRERWNQMHASGTMTNAEIKKEIKAKERLANSQVLFGDLREAHSKFGHFYDNPRLADVRTGEPILEMKAVANRKEAVIIAKVNSKKVQDERSSDRTKKRGGKEWGTGPSEFVDLFMVDDSADTPMRFRIKPENFDLYAKPLIDDPKGTWYLVRAWKLPDIDMFIVKRIKRLEDEPKGIEGLEESQGSDGHEPLSESGTSGEHAEIPSGYYRDQSEGPDVLD